MSDTSREWYGAVVEQIMGRWLVRLCPTCSRAWIPVKGDAPALPCPTCRQGMAPLSLRVGGRTHQEAERAPREREPQPLEER